MSQTIGNKRKRKVRNTKGDPAPLQGYVAPGEMMETYPESTHDSERFSVLLRTLRNGAVDMEDEEPQGISPDESIYKSVKRSWSDAENLEDFNKDTLSQYLKEMSCFPLLTAQEEYELAIRIEKGCKAKEDILRFSGKRNQQKWKILESMVNEGQDAREHLIKANTRLVVSIAKRYIGCGVTFIDLIQEGNLGLMKAVEKFDIHRGFRFSTYATWWIRQAVTRAIAVQSRTIRVPVHMSDRIRQVYKTMQGLEQKLGRPPTIEEAATEMQMDVEKVKWIIKVSWQPLSLDTPIGDDEDADFGSFIEDEKTPSPLQCVQETMLRERIDELLDSLSPREARVLRLRYGLDNGDPITLEEVGVKFGLTRERIRQIEGRALRRLRHPKRMQQLKDYI